MQLTKTYAQMLDELNNYVQSKSNQAVWEHDEMCPEVKAEYILKDSIQKDFTQLDSFVKHLKDNKYDINLDTYEKLRNDKTNIYGDRDDIGMYEWVYSALFYNRNRNSFKNTGYFAEDFTKDDRFQRWYALFPTWNNVKTYKRSLNEVASAINNTIVWQQDPQYAEDFKDVSKSNEGKRQLLYRGR